MQMKLRDILGSLVPGYRGKKQTQDMLENEYGNFGVWHSRKKAVWRGGQGGGMVEPIKEALDDAQTAEEVKENIEELLKFTAPLGGAKCEIVGCTVDVAKNPSLAAKLTGLDLDSPALIDARDDLARARRKTDKIASARSRYDFVDPEVANAAYRVKDEAKQKLKGLPWGKVDEARGLVFAEPPCPDGRARRTITVSHEMEYRGSSGILGWVAPHLATTTYTPHSLRGSQVVSRDGDASEELINSLEKTGVRAVTVQDLIDRSVMRFYEKTVNPEQREEEFMRDGKIAQSIVAREVAEVDYRLKAANDQLLPFVSAEVKEEMEKAGLFSNKARQLFDSTPEKEEKAEQQSRSSRLPLPSANYQKAGNVPAPRTGPGGL